MDMCTEKTVAKGGPHSGSSRITSSLSSFSHRRAWRAEGLPTELVTNPDNCQLPWNTTHGMGA